MRGEAAIKLANFIFTPETQRTQRKPFHRRDAENAEDRQFMAIVKMDSAPSSFWF